MPNNADLPPYLQTALANGRIELNELVSYLRQNTGSPLQREAQEILRETRTPVTGCPGDLIPQDALTTAVGIIKSLQAQVDGIVDVQPEDLVIALSGRNMERKICGGSYLPGGSFTPPPGPAR